MSNNSSYRISDLGASLAATLQSQFIGQSLWEQFLIANRRSAPNVKTSMVSKQKSKLRRRILQGATFALTCLVGVLIGIYLARISIAHYFAEKALAQSNINESRFDWDQLDTDNCSLSDVFIQSESYSMSIEKIDLSYDLSEVWKEKKLKSLNIKGLQLYYDLTGPSTVNLQEVDALIKSGIPFPFDSVQIEGSTVRLLTDFGETNIDLDLGLQQDGNSAIIGNIEAKTGTESVSLDLAISDRIRATIKASVVDLEHSLSENGIEWKEKLPLSRKDVLNASGAEVDANLTFHGITLESASISANAGPLSFRDYDLEAEIESVQASVELLGGEIRNAQSSIQLKRVLLDPLTVSESKIQVSANRLNEVLISMPDTSLQSTNGEKGILSAQLKTVLDDNYAIENYSGKFFVKSLQSDAFDISPFDITLEGTLESAVLSFSDLVNRVLPWLAIENLEANIKGLSSKVPEIAITAQVVADGFSQPEQPAPFSGAWRLDANLFPGSVPQKASLTLVSLDGEPIFSSPMADLGGAASLQTDFDYWSEEREAALTLQVTASDLTTKFEDWSLNGGAASIAISTQSINLLQVGELRNNAPALIEFLAPLLKYNINLQGSELKGPSDLTMQWFSAGVQSIEAIDTKPIQTRLELGAGIVQLGTETLNQFTLGSAIAGSDLLMDTETNVSLLFENEPVSINAVQSFKNITTDLVSDGKYSIEGINLLSSDILSRYLPELASSSASAKINAHGETQYDGEEWDASANIQLREGSFRLPSQELAVDTIEADVRFPSLVSLSTGPSQSITADRITIGDIEATQLRSEFGITGGNQLSVENAGFSIFDGRVAISPFTLSLEDPNADLLIHFNRLSITPAIAMLDFFDGQVTGRLNGTLPIGIRDGYPVLGEGFLELDPSESARFSYNASGFFTEKGAQAGAKKTLGDKLLDRLGLEPNALLEDALGNLSIQTLRLDLFNKNLPLTPMRIQLAGTADTGQAQIPLNITTNVNGTVAELLNFLTRLDSLGLVAGQTPAQPVTSDSNNL